MEGAAMTDGIRYIGKGEFIVTEEWLREVYGLAVEMKIGNWLGVDNWSGWWDTSEAIKELYPDYSKDYDCPQGVAEAIIYDWMNKS